MKLKKLFILTTLIVIVAVPTHAQDNVVKEIRELYASAMQYISEMKDEPHMEKSLTVKKHYVVAAIGVVEETIEYFAHETTEDETDPSASDYVPFFVRVKTDAGPTMMTANEEFLFYPNHSLAFHYQKRREIYEGEAITIEERTYFNDKGKMVSHSVKAVSEETGKDSPASANIKSDAESIKAKAKKYYNGFNAFM